VEQTTGARAQATRASQEVDWRAAREALGGSTLRWAERTLEARLMVRA
jgi:hypothetical protein